MSTNRLSFLPNPHPKEIMLTAATVDSEAYGTGEGGGADGDGAGDGAGDGNGERGAKIARAEMLLRAAATKGYRVAQVRK